MAKKTSAANGVLRPAVFLDRDGTINVEKDYLYRIEDFEFIPGAPKAIRLLNDRGFVVVVVTNQSGIARGYYACDDVEKLHRYMQSQLESYGAHIDRYYYCPHHPESGEGEFVVDCDCRKGKPGMLLRAAEELRIDLPNSYMVGDKHADVEAAVNAGCIPVLVRTGYGEASFASLSVDGEAVPKIFRDVLAAAEWICSSPSGPGQDRL